MPHETEIIIKSWKQPVRLGDDGHAETKHAESETSGHSVLRLWHCVAVVLCTGILIGLAC